MSAYARAKSARRRRRMVVLAGFVLAALHMGPAIASDAESAFDRYVFAEGQGDVAQTIAVQVGRAVASQGGVQKLTVEHTANGCHIAPVGVPVDCATRVAYEPVTGGYTVTVERRGEVFTFDSTRVRL